jgi:hypothetical protein
MGVAMNAITPPPFALTPPLPPFKARPQHVEHQLQRSVRDLLWRLLPRSVFFTAVDHAHKKDGRTGGMLKARGGIKGLPDLWLVHDGRIFLIELKRPGGYLSPTQKDCHAWLRRAGAEVVVCRSPEEVEAALRGWRIPLMGRIAA